MPDPKDPQKDDHIEDLLGQLQGIFGRLSKAEQEEADQKVDVPPRKAPKPTPPVEAPPPTPVSPPVAEPEPEIIPERAPEPPPLPPIPEAPAPEPEYVAPPMPEEPPPPPPPPLPDPVPEPVPEPPPPPVPAPAIPASSPAGGGTYESTIAAAPGDSSILSSAVFFPQGRETEGKTLAGKIETMTPKFAKVAFRLRVGYFASYDSKADWKEAMLAQTLQSGSRALFVVMNSPLDDARRRAIVAELEPRGIYFQEVPLLAIEKKAFYMDLLLGIVFFFDSLKPTGQQP